MQTLTRRTGPAVSAPHNTRPAHSYGERCPACTSYGLGSYCLAFPGLVTADALRRKGQELRERTERLREFRVDLEADGIPYRWSAGAYDQADACRRARDAFSQQGPGVSYSRMRVVACVEGAAL